MILFDPQIPQNFTTNIDNYGPKLHQNLNSTLDLTYHILHTPYPPQHPPTGPPTHLDLVLGLPKNSLKMQRGIAHLIGRRAPIFTCKAVQDGKIVSFNSESLHGKYYVMVFYPLDL